MKILGTECWRIVMRNNIQPREYSKGGGMEGILYTIDLDGNRKLFNVNRNDDGKQYLNGNNGNPDNVWDADARFVFRRRNSLSFFISPSVICWRSFVFLLARAIHRASYLLRLAEWRASHIF